MNRLKDLRKRENLSQTELAEKLKVAQNTLSKWESGQSNIEIEIACEIADYFGVTLDYLFCRDDNPSPVSINNQERKLLEYFRSLSGEKQDAIYNLVETID